MINYVYKLLINITVLLSPLIIIFRILKRKEDQKDSQKNLQYIQKKEKKGKLIWFHAVSVGELLSIVPLIDILEKNKKISQILLTTSTLTSANLFKKFKFIKTTHQFFPIDSNFFANRFLNYWQPRLAIFVDSEIWPNMLLNLKSRSISRILLNARISRKSFQKWKLLGSFSNELFQSFNFTYPQNLESETYLKNFREKNINNIGNLKFAENEIQINQLDNNLKRFLKSKKLGAL